MDEIEQTDDSPLCKAVLATVALALRPLTLEELTFLVEIDEELQPEEIEDIVLRSGSFLTVQSETHDEKIVRFVHQSANDYIVKQARHLIFPDGVSAGHYRLGQKCISRMCEPGVLRKDMCQVSRPGVRRAEFDQDYIANQISRKATYAGGFWAEHLIESRHPLSNNDFVHKFLTIHFLHWFEILSWLGQAFGAGYHVWQLRAQVVKGKRGQHLSSFFDDAYRFVLANNYVADLAPLQVYYSALAFAPTTSIIRTTFKEQCLDIFSLAFSLKERRLTWMANRTVQVLDGTRITNCLNFEGSHRALSSNGKHAVVQVYDESTHDLTFWVCELAGATKQSFSLDREGQGLQRYIPEHVAISPDGILLAMTLGRAGLRVWDVATTTRRLTFNDGSDLVRCIAFSADGTRLAAAFIYSAHGTIRIWNTTSGDLVQIIEGHERTIASLAFSLDGTQLAWSEDRTIRLWDIAKGCALQILEGHTDRVTSLSFSPDGTRLASASRDRTVRLWDVAMSAAIQKSEGHTGRVLSVEFTRDGTQLVSESKDRTMRHWDVATGVTLRIWDTRTGSILHTFDNEHHTTELQSSADGPHLWTGGRSISPWPFPGSNTPSPTTLQPADLQIRGAWI